MWERFMTQPLVDKGEFRRLGECPTPWPCFVIAVRRQILNQHQPQLQKLLQVIYRASESFMASKTAPGLVSRKFGLTPEDAAAWFSQTRWARTHHFPEPVLQNVVNTLLELKLIEQPVAPSQLYENIPDL
jgi:sulfonate transport system substrate-binding protein